MYCERHPDRNVVPLAIIPHHHNDTHHEIQVCFLEPRIPFTPAAPEYCAAADCPKNLHRQAGLLRSPSNMPLP